MPGLDFLATRQQRATAVRATAPAWVFSLELGCQRRVDDQAVVVIEFLAGVDVAQRCDVDAAIFFVSLAVGVATMVDPARGVAAIKRVDYMSVVQVKIERVIGLRRVMRMTAQRFFPRNDLARVLDNAFALGDVRKCEHALAVNA